MKKTFGWFRKVAIAEGVSFLLLLFIAMPLKYFANMPMAVKIMGGIHGVLFVAFIVLAWEVKGDYRKSFLWLLKAGLASLLPLGTFVMDREWRKEEEQVAL